MIILSVKLSSMDILVVLLTFLVVSSKPVQGIQFNSVNIYSDMHDF